MFKRMLALGIALLCFMSGAASAQNAERSTKRIADAPDFKVDARWPKALPNQWLVGQVAGVAVDRHDNIWIVQRPTSLTVDEAGAAQNPPRSECCQPAPSIMKFDKEGTSSAPGAAPPTPAS